MKKFFKAALLAVVVAVAGYGAYEAQSEEMQMSETMLANVEALADDEAFCADCKVCTGEYYVCESNYDAFWNDMLRNCGGFDGILHLMYC